MSFVVPLVTAATSALGGASGIGTILSAGGSILGGISAAQSSKYQARVADMNAQIAEDNAQRAVQSAQVAAEQQDKQTLGMLGQQEAAQSASGLSLTGQSQILTRRAARQLGRQDALNVMQQGIDTAYNYRVDAANQRASAGMARSTATNSLLGGFLGGAQSLIGGSTSVRNPKRFDMKSDPWGNNMRIVQ